MRELIFVIGYQLDVRWDYAAGHPSRGVPIMGTTKMGTQATLTLVPTTTFPPN